jgi:ribonucleotide reductase alpha subunit
MQSKFRYDSALFDAVYGNLELVDAGFSSKLGVSKSIKLTTMKPSGTSSLLAGVTAGGHPAFAPYYIRRVRMAANDPIVDVCRRNGYPIEPEKRLDGSNNLETMVVSFPIATPENTVCASEVSAVNQLDNLSWLQRHWADNSVSCTIYYEQEELPQIQSWLQENYEQLKTVSFLLKTDHGFIQSPMEEISEKEFIALKQQTKEIVSIIENEERNLLDSVECTSGSCPIK